eukprot:Sspe_Gene.64868::Locus_38425_Transcript_1_1_Confidence_1.000_Length_421::g.64868::m.64868
MRQNAGRPLYTSANALNQAKRLHTTDMQTTPRNVIQREPAEPSEVHTSLEQFESEKRVHMTSMLESPRRHGQQSPRSHPVFGHDHDNMPGPPYHTSCRQFAVEKGEHLTPVFPMHEQTPYDPMHHATPPRDL